VVDRAKLVILDLIGCNLAGSLDDGMAQFARALGRRPGLATLVGTSVRADPAAAALFNGSATVALELDETNRFAKGHPVRTSGPRCSRAPRRLGAAERTFSARSS